jgi:hypothetical protein
MNKKALIILFLFLLFGQLLKAQDSAIYGVVPVGDAGEIAKQHMAVLGFAANSVVKDKTTVTLKSK